MPEILSYQSGMSNGYFIKDGDNAIAVDSGAEMGEEAVRKNLEKCGLAPENIKLIVITHGHVDHFMNVAALASVTGAPVLCHKNAARFIREGLLPDEDIEGRTKMGYEMLEDQKKHGNPVDSAPSGPVDIEIGDEDYDLSEWGVDAKTTFTPGHTRGCISIIVGDEAIVGDLFSAPAWTDYVGMAYFQYIGAPYDVPQKSVQKLLDMGIKKFWPGHGNPRDDAFVRNALEEEKAGKEMYYPLEVILK